jgi:thiamine-phosphate pyrophosphorylase
VNLYTKDKSALPDPESDAMRFELTPAVARAFQAAQAWAGRQGALAVQPEHLLHGLLEEEEGRASTLLAAAGLDLTAARTALAATDQGVVSPQPVEVPLPHSPESQAALALARDLASDLSPDSTVPSEAVLLALLREDAELRRRLVELGLKFDRLEGHFAAAQGPPLALDEPLCLSDPVEQVDTSRILDAGANRAREALRVLEDYCRFSLDDAILSGELKQLRHELAEALAGLPSSLLLEARETQGDVGTSLTAPREHQRHSLLAVVQANVKRLQEALRSLEEFGKLHGADLGRVVEQLRYRSYTLERALVLGTTARQRLADARLQVLLTGSLCAAALDWTIQEAAAGGADIIQLREKNLDDRALLDRARRVRRWTRQAGVLFIMNDRPDIARLAEADGVHLGQEDMPVKDARRILGPDVLIGVSTHTLEQVRQAILDGASYLGVGPTFPSGTKDFEEYAGLDFVRQATAATRLPLFVIGGVNLETVGAAVAAGARRIAVSQAICLADDPRPVAAALRQALKV